MNMETECTILVVIVLLVLLYGGKRFFGAQLCTRCSGSGMDPAVPTERCFYCGGRGTL